MGEIRARWPAGLFGMLALVALIEGACARRSSDLGTLWTAAWSRAARVVGHEAKRNEIWFFGDSLVMQGVDPEVVSETAGRSAYNFALFKGLPDASFGLLERALATGARPAAVCIDGELLGDDPNELVRLWPELLKWCDIVRLGASTGNWKLASQVMLGKLLPTLKSRHEVREWIIAGLDGATWIRSRDLRQIQRHWDRHKGANLVAADENASRERDRALDDADYWPDTWECDPQNAVALEMFLDAADHWNIPVFWLMPPIHPEIQRRRDTAGLTALYDRFVRDLQARHPRLMVLDARYCGFPSETLADYTHLNRDGAAAFSALLGGALKEQLDATASAPAPRRWLALGSHDEAAGVLAARKPRGAASERVDQAERTGQVLSR